MAYPTDDAGRQQLADELTAKGLKPTQLQRYFFRDKINAFVAKMLNGTFDWKKASLKPVVLGPDGEIVGGHHRVIAAYLAGIDLTAIPGPRPQIQHVARCFRIEYDWIDVLPEVQ
ncbi:MAG: hypothetical protein HY289_07010 [Planctomycetes bacterium]|nr:hypothetical protein [Planctomycetota bacterium]